MFVEIRTEHVASLSSKLSWWKIKDNPKSFVSRIILIIISYLYIHNYYARIYIILIDWCSQRWNYIYIDEHSILIIYVIECIMCDVSSPSGTLSIEINYLSQLSWQCNESGPIYTQYIEETLILWHHHSICIEIRQYSINSIP